jgi:hypothetical protein
LLKWPDFFETLGIMKTTTLPSRNLTNRSPLRSAFVLIPFVLTCFVLSSQARATCQDACLTNDNTVQGDDALISLTTGTDNTAIGRNALNGDTTGFNNTATGAFVLSVNTTGFDNTGNGVSTLRSNVRGYCNTATGFQALYSNTIAEENTANGVSALLFNTTGGDNTANGFSALLQNTTGFKNTACGHFALYNNTIGHDNIALGVAAGISLTTGNGNIDIGNAGVGAESKTIRIGTTGTQTNAYVAGISGVTVAAGIGVIIDSSGHLGTITSSARFKEEIKPMDKASEAILALKPVTFRYKQEVDPKGVPQFGLVAEEVEKVNPDLVARDDQRKPYTVRYEAVNAMLLNEFLKEHRKVEEQGATIARLEAALKKQGAQIEKVNAQLATERVRPIGGLEVSRFAAANTANGRE